MKAVRSFLGLDRHVLCVQSGLTARSRQHPLHLGIDRISISALGCCSNQSVSNTIDTSLTYHCHGLFSWRGLGSSIAHLQASINASSLRPDRRITSGYSPPTRSSAIL